MSVLENSIAFAGHHTAFSLQCVNRSAACGMLFSARIDGKYAGYLCVAAESGSRDTPVWCMIYDDLKYTEEAHIFADQQKNVKKLTPYETFAAHIEAGDAKQMMIKTIVESLDLKYQIRKGQTP
jgi:hypothetical protein